MLFGSLLWFCFLTLNLWLSLGISWRKRWTRPRWTNWASWKTRPSRTFRRCWRKGCSRMYKPGWAWRPYTCLHLIEYFSIISLLSHILYKSSLKSFLSSTYYVAPKPPVKNKAVSHWPYLDKRCTREVPIGQGCKTFYSPRAKLPDWTNAAINLKGYILEGIFRKCLIGASYNSSTPTYQENESSLLPPSPCMRAALSIVVYGVFHYSHKLQ